MAIILEVLKIKILYPQNRISVHNVRGSGQIALRRQ